MKTYGQKVHILGRTTMAISIVAMVLVPLVMSLVLGEWPKADQLFKGLLAVWLTFIPVNFIEFFTFTPMLGSSGAYLAFITGNVSNLKLPCALNTMEVTGVKRGTEESDIISTIAIATSSIVTIVMIILGLVLLMLGSDILGAPVLAPAFDYVLPALFGGLALVLIGKNAKLAIAPLILAVIIYGLGIILNLTGHGSGLLNTITNPTIVIVLAAAVSISAARIMYKKGKINLNNYK